MIKWPIIFKDLADEIENEELSLEKRQACPTITFPCGPGTTMPAVCKNMQYGIGNGHPAQLHRVTDSKVINKNRRDSGCTKMPKQPGYNCDEYPFASSKEGTKFSHSIGVHLGEVTRDWEVSLLE
jgi:ribosomal protein S27AE